MTDDLFQDEPIERIAGNEAVKAKAYPSVTIKDNKGRATRRRPYHVDLGFGPDGKHCADCQHLIATRYSKIYYKCGKHPITGGPGTQIGKRDLACAWFEPKPEAIGHD